jgi:hypothetical protein
MKNTCKLLMFVIVMNTGCTSFATEPTRSLAGENQAKSPMTEPESLDCKVYQKLIGTDEMGTKVSPPYLITQFKMQKNATAMATFYRGSVKLIDGSTLQAGMEIISRSQKTALFTWLKGNDVLAAASSTTHDEPLATASASLFDPKMASFATDLNMLNPGRFEPVALEAIDGKYLGKNAKPTLASLMIFCK